MNDYALLAIAVHVMEDGTEVYTEVTMAEDGEVIEVTEEL